MLKGLASQLDADTSSPSPFSGLQILAEDTQNTASSNSDLRSVRVKVRCPIHGSIKDFEKYLAERTVPSMETAECQEFAKQIHLERWSLESCMHSLKRFELDQEHDKNAIDFDEVAVQESSDDATATSPFRLISFGARDGSLPSQSLLEDNLKHLIRVRSENLESMSFALERLKAKARGFLSMTGSPLIEPVVRPLTASRLFVLFFLCALVWFLLMMWLYPVRGIDWFCQTAKGFFQKTSTSSRWFNASPSSTTDFNKTILWMQREGIPYLGEIHVISQEDCPSDPTFPILHQGDSKEPSAPVPICDGSVSQHSIKWLRSLGEGSLVLWIGLLVARSMFDPIWRELVAVAPLAAISRMIFGIQ